MKAQLELFWKPSVDIDTLSSRKVVVNIDGNETTYDTGIEASSLVVEAAAGTTVTFTTTVTDKDGLVTQSQVFSQTLGDLIAPQPDTELGIRILGVTDDAEVPPTE